MRTILAGLPDWAVFDPAAVESMSLALDEACAALGITAAKDRETIAMRIIDLARRGTVDANALRDRVIAEARSTA